MNLSTERLIVIKGPVQGIGTRPFCKVLADRLSLAGHVVNRGDSVELRLAGSADNIETFIQALSAFLPAAARWQGVTTASFNEPALQPFQILHSLHASHASHTQQGDKPCASVSRLHANNLCLMPDRVPCQACLSEFFDPNNRRYAYPFISCTDCGPRFSIMRRPTSNPMNSQINNHKNQDMSWNRTNTHLAEFPLCAACSDEYHSPDNRRFYAQGISCPDCGPTLCIDGKKQRVETQAAVDDVLAVLDAGGIVAVKSLSGFHLLVDPQNASAIARLRQIKQRPAKPFAVMMPTLDMVSRFCEVSDEQAQLLKSPAGPLVLLASLPAVQRPAWMAHIAPGLSQAAVMLPTTGFYHALARRRQQPWVVTSANRKGSALITCIEDLTAQFESAIDLVLDHTLTLEEGLDDSIVQWVEGAPMVLRSSRGYAPQVMAAPALISAPGSICGLGAWHKNSVAAWDGEQLYLSRYLGDLDTQTIWQQHVHYVNTMASAADQVITDTHPDMRDECPKHDGPKHGDGKQNTPSFALAHHVAHALSVRWEHPPEPRQLSIVWDGLGYPAGERSDPSEGSMPSLFGGEGYFCDAVTDWPSHVATLHPMALPGGDLAMRTPALVALSLLHAIGEHDAFEQKLVSMPDSLQAQQVQWIGTLFSQQPLPFTMSSSVGRLFDGVASLLGVCDVNSYEAEAAMRLQALCGSTAPNISLPVVIDSAAGQWIVDWRPAIKALWQAREEGISAPMLATAFLQYLAACIAALVEKTQANQLVLAGGCFQNARLLEAVCERVRAMGVSVCWPQHIPINDSGIAAGQVMAGLLKQHDNPQ